MSALGEKTTRGPSAKSDRLKLTSVAIDPLTAPSQRDVPSLASNGQMN
jgi:hypothetical protein